MKTVRTKAIVLRRTNYGEADRILQLLTPDGRRSVIAKGVRREKSKLAGGIELFAVTDVVIGEGRGDLGIITSARLIHFYNHIIEDYDRLQFGYTVIKQVARASETLDEPEWFLLLSEVLVGLDTVSLPLDMTRIWFYVRFADILGHRLNLETDVAGKKLQADLRYRYDSAEQGLVESSNGLLEATHIKLLRLISSKSLAVLVQIGGVDSVLQECLSVARQHAAIED
jgi:DNA repair protein RecO (recombination protein O)